MSDQDSFQDLLSQLREGDETAACKIFRKYTDQLVRKARTRLDPMMRKKVDAEDIVQSVYRSFFVRYREGEFQLENWESLWCLLLTITFRKCGRQIGRFR